MPTTPTITKVTRGYPFYRVLPPARPAGAVVVSGTADPGTYVDLFDLASGGGRVTRQGTVTGGDGRWSADLTGLILGFDGNFPFGPGLHLLAARASQSYSGAQPGPASAPVQVRVGANGGDAALVGLSSSDTAAPGPNYYAFGGPGSDTVTAYDLPPDPATGRRGPAGATVFVDGGNAVPGASGDAPDTATDTAVVPVPLGEVASHAYRWELGTHLVLRPRLAPQVDVTDVERLRFSDVTLTVQKDRLADFLFYDQTYPDMAAADANARQHYDQSGWREGRDPDALFSTRGYLGAYGDVRAAGVNPLDHYDAQGWREGRDPSALFDTTLYLRYNPDVAAAGIDPLAHYLGSGMVEGRRSLPAVGSAVVRDAFDPLYYALANPDVSLSGLDPLLHWQQYGRFEGRNPDGFFDVGYYLSRNPDVAASGLDALDHYDRFGWREGRDPSTHFNTAAYLAANQDVAAAGINPLQHFLQYGAAEGRSAFGDIV